MISGYLERKPGWKLPAFVSPVPVVTSVAAAAIVAATTATAVATTTSTAKAILRTIRFWTCLVDTNILAVEFGIVKFTDGFEPFFFVGHLHEAEATGSAGIAVLNDFAGSDGAIGIEKGF